MKIIDRPAILPRSWLKALRQFQGNYVHLYRGENEEIHDTNLINLPVTEDLF